MVIDLERILSSAERIDLETLRQMQNEAVPA
jgi:hypothetical protein